MEKKNVVYRGTALSDALSVTEIYTVLSPDLVKNYPGTGESHPFPEILYLARGEHTLLVDRERHTLREGQIILYAPGSYHEASDVRPTLADAFVLTFECTSPLLLPLYNRAITLTARQRTMLDAFFAEGVQYFEGRAPDDTVRGMVLRAGVDERALWGLRKQIELFLLDLSEREAPPKSKRELRHDAEFAAVTDFLGKNLATPLSLSQIALAAQMSVSKLKLLFRERTGSGPIDYLIRLRIERAEELIREGEYNLSEISERVGFSSLHYFSRTFKSITGVSPSQYAKRQ